MAAKADNIVTLLLLNAVTSGGTPSQADQAATRAAVLDQLGLTEDEAAEQLADARDKAEQAAAKADDAEAETEAAGGKGSSSGTRSSRTDQQAT